jgi:hypothetical protein
MRLLSAVVVLLCACHSPTSPPPEAPPTLTLTSIPAGQFSLHTARGTKPGFDLRNAAVRVRVDGAVLSTSGHVCTNSPSVPLDCALGDGLHLTLTATPSDDGLQLRAQLSTDATPHLVDGFEVLSMEPDDASFEVPRNTGQLRYLHNGYQSWSFAGSLDLPGNWALPRKNGVRVYAAPDGTNAVDEVIGLSSHDAIIDGGDGSALVLGFISVDRWQSAIALESQSPHFVVTAQNGFTGDAARLTPGAPVASETLLVHHALTVEAAMTAYGHALDSLRSHANATPRGQRGWFSWNRFFAAIDEPTVRRAAGLLRTIQGLDLVEIDDGWEKAWGDWTPNEKFPGFDKLATDLGDGGQRLGVWVAPFVVDRGLPIVAEHPDWWVQGADGKPLNFQPFATTQHLVVVDVTVPAALAWMTANLTRLRGEGVLFFKLDYLYAAALDGRRADPDVTGVEALRRGLDALLAVPDVEFNLCGVPWLHAALASKGSIRIGSDVAFNTGPYGFVFVSSAARNLAARAFGPLADRSDLDQFWLKPLTLDETRTALALQVLTGANFALADDLAELDEGHRTAVTELAALSLGREGNSLFAAGPFAVAGEKLLGSPAEEALSGANHVQSALPSTVFAKNLTLVTNWTDEPATIPVSAPANVHALSGPAPVDGAVRLAPHQSSLFEIILLD